MEKAFNAKVHCSMRCEILWTTKVLLLSLLIQLSTKIAMIECEVVGASVGRLRKREGRKGWVRYLVTIRKISGYLEKSYAP